MKAWRYVCSGDGNKNKVPLFSRPAAVNWQSPGAQTSLSRGQTRRGRCTSARSGQIRVDFCPYLSGITPALPIRLQSRAGASGFSQVSGCPGLAVMTARDRIQKSFAQHPETARCVPHQKENSQSLLTIPRVSHKLGKLIKCPVNS